MRPCGNERTALDLVELAVYECMSVCLSAAVHLDSRGHAGGFRAADSWAVVVVVKQQGHGGGL